VAWVFSSGGPRGFVHVGVLKGLVALGLRPDLVVGASVGALVGCLWAAGRTVAEIEALALDLEPWTLARVALGTAERLSAEPIAELVRTQAPRAQLEHLSPAMAVVAYRRDDGQVVAFTAGDAGLAVMASAAVEGRFAPVRIRGRTYVDADWHQPLPVRTARALGARRVLAVDATVHLDRRPPGAERYLDGDRRKQALLQPDVAAADLTIKPDFGYWVGMDRAFRERAIRAGYEETLASASSLRALHAT